MIVELTYEIFPTDDAESNWHYRIFLNVPENGQQYVSVYYGPDILSNQDAVYFAKDIIKRLKDGRGDFSVIFPRFCDKYPGVKLEVI